MKNAHFPNQIELVSLAKQAGEIMRKNFVSGMEREWKEDQTPLTKSDLKINRLVIEWIQNKYPHITVIGEEESRIIENSEYVVLVDPIDGTVPFCQGVPVSTFCISILKNSIPVVAVIHEPFTNRTWSAEKGMGTTLNNTPVQVSKNRIFSQSTISIIWWKNSIGNLHKVCNEIIEKDAKWFNLCSVAIAGGLISSGDLAASIFPGQKIWETAAMQLLVEEAGGIATDLYGNKLVYGADMNISGHVMSNGLIHEKLIEIITQVN